MVCLDALLLASLLVFRRSWRRPLTRGPKSFFAQTLSATRYALPALALAGIFAFGSLDAAMGYLSGARLLPTTSDKYAGRLQGGQTASISFDLTNYSHQDVRILGAKTTCNCVALEDLPLELAPGTTGTVHVKLRARGEQARLQRESATLIFDDPARRLTLTVTASITPSG